MCGIAGIVNLTGDVLPLNRYIEKMTDVLKHRGPDDRGFAFFSENGSTQAAGNAATASQAWNSNFAFAPKTHISDVDISNKIAFGHCRLSVIDVSAAGHQPMCNVSQDIWIILNGEIYNYIELRSELEGLGCRFVTKSDTEVLLAAYEIWGTDCLSRLNGMWSFVIFDKKKNILFGSRDRTGVKPFYYYKDNQVFCFASEPKALHANELVKTEINQSEVFNLLVMARADYNGTTLFENINELAPAHFFTLQLADNKFDIQQYFTLSINNSTELFNEKKNSEYVELIKQQTFNAVDKRLRADIPIGFCLSGGIDSSSILCMVDQLNKSKKLQTLGSSLTAFTAVNHVKNSDEAHWAKLVVDQLGVNWVTAECTSTNMMDLLPEMVYYQDSPLLSTSTYAQYKVMETAKAHSISILIDGQGGDELFAGYVPFYTSLFLNFIKNGQFSALQNELKHLSNSPFSSKLFALTSVKLFLEYITPQMSKAKSFRTSRPESSYVDEAYWLSNTNTISFSKGYSTKPLNDFLSEYYAGYYLKNLLRWEDRCSMRFSIESRTPFSDDLELMNTLFAIPSVYKIRNGWNKSLLRSSMQGVIPELIRQRTDKLGFSTPQDLWLKQSKVKLYELLADLPDSTSFINKQLLLKNWNSIFDGDNTKLQNFAFRYVNYLLWQKAFQFTK